MAFTYDTHLVVLSLAVSFLSAYTGVRLLRFIHQIHDSSRNKWIVVFSAVMGIGISSVHYIGMIGSHVGGMIVNYNPAMIIVSLLTPMLSTYIAFHGMNPDKIGRVAVGVSSLVLSVGICGMHFTGMSALEMEGSLHYHFGLLSVAFLLCFGMTFIAFDAFFYAKKKASDLLTMLLFGGSIFVLHYGAMLATTVNIPKYDAHSSWNYYSMAMFIGWGTMLMSIIVIFLLVINKRLLMQMKHLSEMKTMMFDFFEQTDDCIFIINTDDERYMITGANRAASKRLGYSKEELQAKSLLDITAEEQVDVVKQVLDRLSAGDHDSNNLEIVIVTKNGEKTVNQLIFPYKLEAFRRSVVYLKDITVNKRLESLLLKEKSVLELIARDAPLPDVLESISANVEEQLRGSKCAILLLDESKQVLRHGSSKGFPQQYLEATDGLRVGENEGSCGTAAYRNETVIVSDISTSPLWEKYRPIALKYQLLACFSAPINRADGTVAGTFAIYFDHCREPSSYDLKVLEKMVHLTALCIEYKRQKQAIEQKNEEKFNLIVSNISNLIWLVDDTGLIHYASPSNGRLLGIQPEEMVGGHLWRYIDVQDIVPVQDTISTVKSIGKELTIEFRIGNRSGETLTMYASINPLKETECGQESYLIVAKDITAKKLAQRLREESEQRYRSLFTYHPAAVFSFDKEGHFIDGNEAVVRVTGYELQEIVNKPFDIMVMEEEQARTREHFQLAALGFPQSYESTVRHKNGHPVYLSITNLPIIVDGQIVGVHGVAHDITEEKQMQEELARLAADLEEVVQQQNGLLFKLKKAGDRFIYTMVRGSLLNRLGYRYEEIVGSEWHSFLQQEPSMSSFEPYVRYYEEVWNGKERAAFYIEIAGGIYIISLRPIRKSGKIAEIVGFCLKYDELYPTEGSPKLFMSEASTAQNLALIPKRCELTSILENMISSIDGSEQRIVLRANDVNLWLLGEREKLEFAFSTIVQRMIGAHPGKLVIDIEREKGNVTTLFYFDSMDDSVRSQTDWSSPGPQFPLELAISRINIEEVGGQLLLYHHARLEMAKVVLPDIPAGSTEKQPVSPRLDKLTRREQEVFNLVGVGKTNKEIAAELSISENTVKNHIANIFNKLDIYDRMQVIGFFGSAADQ
ncbi:PAS domain S-box protein [Paenibacillus thermotolerans]|uniref:PAS domain S-box protein n=1 Tax=Paenibacillus thermotolerans TaxID=3027807 RepID=UPI002367847A|nr:MULTISPECIES: PAS domain S-box protein [unclassified Paenibacillus]